MRGLDSSPRSSKRRTPCLAASTKFCTRTSAQEAARQTRSRWISGQKTITASHGGRCETPNRFWNGLNEKPLISDLSVSFQSNRFACHCHPTAPESRKRAKTDCRNLCLMENKRETSSFVSTGVRVKITLALRQTVLVQLEITS